VNSNFVRRCQYVAEMDKIVLSVVRSDLKPEAWTLPLPRPKNLRILSFPSTAPRPRFAPTFDPLFSPFYFYFTEPNRAEPNFSVYVPQESNSHFFCTIFHNSHLCRSYPCHPPATNPESPLGRERSVCVPAMHATSAEPEKSAVTPETTLAAIASWLVSNA